MYSIKVNPVLGLVEVRLSDLMTVSEVADYIAELKSAFVRHRLREWLFLLDVREAPIQQQDVIRAMGEHMATMPKAKAIGVVTGSSLAKMQVRRLFTQPYARITDTIEEAHAWVVAGTEPKGATAHP